MYYICYVLASEHTVLKPVYILLPVCVLISITLHNMNMCWQCNGWLEGLILFESINEISHFDKTKDLYIA